MEPMGLRQWMGRRWSAVVIGMLELVRLEGIILRMGLLQLTVIQGFLLCSFPGCLLLGAVLQVSHSVGEEESVESLDDVVSLRDQARFEQVLSRAEPYHSVREAYLVAKGVHALGLTATNKKVLRLT